MRHAKPYRKLSRHRSHYRALMRNLAQALFLNERVRTTLVKAKEVRPFIDKIITLGKAGTLQARRQAFALMGNKTATAEGKKFDYIGTKVFKEFATRYKDRSGGYTRIIRLGNRPGDCAPMAYLELIDATLKIQKSDDSKEAAPKAKAKPKTKAKADKKVEKAA
ncbi:MAG: 50S ribosomal protein L17 [Deltaproteobacteria bacterium]|nr:50S ribosomal protein L17 [Deltaproteobacteria bacterium]